MEEDQQQSIQGQQSELTEQGEQAPAPEGRLIVGNISYNTIEADLIDYFNQEEKFELKIPRNKATGRSKGLAIVDFDTKEKAQAVIDEFDQKEFMGRKLYITFASEKKPIINKRSTYQPRYRDYRTQNDRNFQPREERRLRPRYDDYNEDRDGRRSRRPDDYQNDDRGMRQRRDDDYRRDDDFRRQDSYRRVDDYRRQDDDRRDDFRRTDDYRRSESSYRRDRIEDERRGDDYRRDDYRRNDDYMRRDDGYQRRESRSTDDDFRRESRHRRYDSP